MADQNKDFDDLERLFAQGRQQTRQLPEGLARRIEADGSRVQAGFARPAPVRAKPGLWAQIVASIGGWPTLGGVATAGAAGIWIGLAAPSFLPDPAQYLFVTGQDIDLIGLDDMVTALAEEG